ncbi:MAG TPA: PepSY domain-containing protein [Methylophilaceae bacterium]|nr:PepSY domain-containing protein [Methylophilaceae bacterium]
MKPIYLSAFVMALSFAASTAFADNAQKLPKTKYSIEHCLSQALKVKNGTMVKSELKMEDKTAVYEFDIETPDGKAWDVECSTKTGKIIETEEEVDNADDAQFKPKMKVSEEDARKTALAAYPGEIIEVEYEIEVDGTPTYEFDILTQGGKVEMKVEIDAITGKLVEADHELVQIGKEKAVGN